MPNLDLTVRYSRESTDPDQACLEEYLGQGELQWSIPSEQAAIVLVDCWDIHPIESHRARGAEIARERILPAVQSCRKAGVTVVHAPSPGQARMYPQWLKYASDTELFGPGTPAPQWPTPEMRTRQGEYATFAHPPQPRHREWIEKHLHERKIMEFLGPAPEDFVVANGEQLHRLCRDRGVFHLFYAGFAANICVQRRDYGVWPMIDRGYNIILLRDCTTAIEMSRTWEGMWLTQASILDIELRAVSSTSEELIKACKAVS